MYDKENNVIKQEFNAFHGQAWKTYNDNTPMISFGMNDGYGGSVGQTLTVEEAVEVIDLLETLIAQAKETPDHDLSKWDETPF